jgi:hypothetical protein
VTEAAIEVQPPSQDERTMAILAHVLQLVGWWIAPLVIFLVKRESRFTSFHALQALLLQMIQVIFTVSFMVLWLGIVFSSIIQHPPPRMGRLLPFSSCSPSSGWVSWPAGRECSSLRLCTASRPVGVNGPSIPSWDVSPAGF